MLVGPILLAAAAVMHPARAPIDDAAILGLVLRIDSAEIATGTIAQQRTAAAEVRDYATLLIHDHQQCQSAVDSVATLIRVSPNAPADTAGARIQSQLVTRLASLRDAEFDRAYLQAMADAHTRVLSRIRTTLRPAARDDRLKAFLDQVLIMVQQHQQAAARLANAHKG